MCTEAIIIHQVLELSRFNYQGSAAGACRIWQSKISGGPLGTWPPWSTSTDAVGKSWLMITSEWQESNSYCKHTNAKATLWQEFSTCNANGSILHRLPVSSLTIAEEHLSSARTRCEFNKELTSGRAIVALSIIATATLKESMTMITLNTITAHTICAAWAAWRALRERTGQYSWRVGLGMKLLQRPHCKPGLQIRSIVEIKQAFKDTGKPRIKILQRNYTSNIWHVSNTCQSALGICARSFLACMIP
jgi:hypothetical protein